MAAWHVAADGRRFSVYRGRCLCSPCWVARCACGARLTAHAFSADGAVAEALAVLSSDDPRPGVGHAVARCPDAKVAA